ncbi:MAG: transcriptional regulator [Deltaproteobacteria bacterium CG11_big_fil_rev_8_21_14_0_20_49_13]|nr:MAG: transcriptional regulator [Deltaproteobacteria bacterium CG11_big_fil_rev_8_21_14_0_20_49_13]
MNTGDIHLQKLLKDIGKNIRRVRNQKNLTQEQLDGRGFNYRWLQYIESGSRNINVSTLLRIAQALKVSVSEFFKDIS